MRENQEMDHLIYGIMTTDDDEIVEGSRASTRPKLGGWTRASNVVCDR